MAQFSYRARDNSGQEVSGYRDAENIPELSRLLRSQGFWLLSAKDTSASNKRFDIGGIENRIPLLNKIITVPRSDKIIFTRNMGVMLGAGLPITRALDSLRRETRSSKFKEVNF